MEFNIKKIIDKININNIDFQKKQHLKKILDEYDIDISFQDIFLQKGILSFKNISPLKKIHIKKNKNKVIQEAHKKDIYIRDII